MNVIHRSNVNRTVLRYGNQATRPVVQIIVGAILTLAIVWPFYHLWHVFKYGGKFFVGEGAIGGFSIIGVWLIYSALKKGWYLELTTRRGIEKLAFHREVEISELQDFLARVHKNTDIIIETGPEVNI